MVPQCPNACQMPAERLPAALCSNAHGLPGAGGIPPPLPPPTDCLESHYRKPPGRLPPADHAPQFGHMAADLQRARAVLCRLEQEVAKLQLHPGKPWPY